MKYERSHIFEILYPGISVQYRHFYNQIILEADWKQISACVICDKIGLQEEIELFRLLEAECLRTKNFKE